MLALRRGVAPAEREAAGDAAASRVMALPEVAACRRVALYAALPDELPTRALYERARRAGKELLWPRVSADGELELAPCGVWEDLIVDARGALAPPPSSASTALAAGDVIVMPGVAFARDGARLGRGGGHYDRLLAARRGELCVGLAFDFQVVSHLPEEAHDRRVDLVVTPRGLWRSGQWQT